MLERNDRIGGCLRTEEITAPGFVHDVMATTLVLFLTSPAYGAIGKDLEARARVRAYADCRPACCVPTARICCLRWTAATSPRSSARGRRRRALRRRNGRIGADAPFLFALLGGSLWSRAMLKISRARPGGAGRAGSPAGSARRSAPRAPSWRRAINRTSSARLLAPWVLHCGLNPESAYSGQMVKVIAFAIELAGCPIVIGGAGTR